MSEPNTTNKVDETTTTLVDETTTTLVEDKKVSFTTLIDNKTTQKYVLGQIFQNKVGEWISKREVEKQLVLRWSFRNISDIKQFSNFEDLFEKADNVPGDIQRDLRLFFDKYHKYGLEKKERSEHEPLSYRWNPINESDLENIIHPTARNIFKDQSELKAFYKLKNNKCEMCEKSSKDNDTLRMAVDHWRAHSKYNIDNKGIAVLLCETCNNIHHDYDASKVALKYKDTLKIVKNWVKKELEIRAAGFPPNDENRQQQKEIINQITKYWEEEEHPLPSDFWKGLDTIQ